MEARLLLGALLCAGLPPGELPARVGMAGQSSLAATNPALLFCSLASARCRSAASRRWRPLPPQVRAAGVERGSCGVGCPSRPNLVVFSCPQHEQFRGTLERGRPRRRRAGGENGRAVGGLCSSLRVPAGYLAFVWDGHPRRVDGAEKAQRGVLHGTRWCLVFPAWRRREAGLLWGHSFGR